MAHQYFFSFAEVEYNPISKKIEASIQLTGHDFEDVIQKEKGKKILLENLNDADKELIEVYLNDHFKFSNSEESSHFHLIGAEIDLKGTVSFYLESDPIDLFEETKCKFNVLMASYESQQNKLTFIYKNQKTTYDFLVHEQQRTISIKSE